VELMALAQLRHLNEKYEDLELELNQEDQYRELSLDGIQAGMEINQYLQGACIDVQERAENIHIFWARVGSCFAVPKNCFQYRPVNLDPFSPGAYAPITLQGEVPWD
jgi:hypothetical protein